MEFSQSHGVNGDPWPRCPPTFCWVHLLPVVWERRPKWRDGGQPPKDHTLQARPSVWQVLWVSNHHKWYPLHTMLITIVAKSLLLQSQSHLTNPSSGPLLRSWGRTFYSGPPGEKARLISEEGGVCQSTNPSIVSTKFDKAAACFEKLQFLLFT